MIVKIDHMTYVTERKKMDDAIKRFEKDGYICKFVEKGLVNISNKQALLKNKQPTHDLCFMEREDDIPIEVIGYDKVNINKSNEYVKDLFKIEVGENEGFLEVFRALNADKIGKNLFLLRGKLDKRGIRINCCKGDFEDNEIYLDDKGFGCITLLVDSIKKTEKEMKKYNLKCSEVSELEVNNKRLYIFFVTTERKTDIIIEFIGFRL